MGRTIVNRRNLANFGGNIQPAATPIDTYYRPIKQTPPENEAVAGIINALKMVNPALEKYGDRVALFSSLAYNNWIMDEMSNGTAWRMINES